MIWFCIPVLASVVKSTCNLSISNITSLSLYLVTVFKHGLMFLFHKTQLSFHNPPINNRCFSIFITSWFELHHLSDCINVWRGTPGLTLNVAFVPTGSDTEGAERVQKQWDGSSFFKQASDKVSMMARYYVCSFCRLCSSGDDVSKRVNVTLYKDSKVHYPTVSHQWVHTLQCRAKFSYIQPSWDEKVALLFTTSPL